MQPNSLDVGGEVITFLPPSSDDPPIALPAGHEYHGKIAEGGEAIVSFVTKIAGSPFIPRPTHTTSLDASDVEGPSPTSVAVDDTSDSEARRNVKKPIEAEQDDESYSPPQPAKAPSVAVTEAEPQAAKVLRIEEAGAKPQAVGTKTNAFSFLERTPKEPISLASRVTIKEFSCDDQMQSGDLQALAAEVLIGSAFGARSGDDPYYPFAKAPERLYFSKSRSGKGSHFNSLSQFYFSGTLWSFAQKMMPMMPLPERGQLIKRLFVQLLFAVEHMNKHGVAHRDLTCSNILIEMVECVDGTTRVQVRITDYGHACLLVKKRGTDKCFYPHNCIGTHACNPPEVQTLKHKDHAMPWDGKDLEGCKVDAFHVGIALRFMCFLAYDKEALQEFLLGTLPMNLDEELAGYGFDRAFLEVAHLLLDPNAEDRWTAEDALEHLCKNSTDETIQDEIGKSDDATAAASARLTTDLPKDILRITASLESALAYLESVVETGDHTCELWKTNNNNANQTQ